MTEYVSILNGMGGNGAKAYRCIGCRGLITHSDRLLAISGSNRHQFTNPAGVECVLHTFSACPGAITVGDSTAEYTWFLGYGWRFAFCRQCGMHMGWLYQAVSGFERPREFWGILVERVVSD